MYISSVKQNTVCEKRWMVLTCPSGQVLNIDSVVYGRTDNAHATCLLGTTPPNDNCRSATAQDKVREE